MEFIKHNFVDYKTEIKDISEYATSGMVSASYYAFHPENKIVNGGQDFRFYLKIMPSSEKLIKEYRAGAQISLDGEVLQKRYGLVDLILSFGQLRPRDYPYGFRGKILVDGKEKYRAILTSSEVPELFWDTEIFDPGERDS